MIMFNNICRYVHPTYTVPYPESEAKGLAFLAFVQFYCIRFWWRDLSKRPPYAFFKRFYGR